ncbi:MAG: hypothetical protein Q6363_005985 [Candidatus Njordarchaeota archaeon]
MKAYDVIRQSLRKTVSTFKKNLLLIIIFSLAYGLTAYFFREEIIAGSGDIRPTIFVPSLAAIVFGPLIGGFIGGIGNLIYDAINKMIIEHEMLKLKHLIGFLANFVGAFIVGLLREKPEISTDESIFSKKMVKVYLKNTFYACLGMGVIVGAIIGFGLWLIGDKSFEVGMIIATGITFWNTLSSMFLLIALPAYFYLEKRAKIRRLKEIQELKTVKAVETPAKSPVIIEKAEFLGTGAIEKEWCLFKISIKNNLNEKMKFRVEIIAPDIIIPSVKYSAMIEPNDSDEITFSIYPLDSGERHLKINIKPWPSDLEKQKEILEQGYTFAYMLKYKAKKDEPETIRAFVSMISILMILAITIKALFSVFNYEEFQVVLIALSVFVTEIALTIIWYIWKKTKLKH